MPKCLNCNTSFGPNDNYCNSCGQKTKSVPLTLWTIVNDFLSNLFNIESKLFTTIKDLFKPGKLALSYIAGKRSRYYNPVRMFLIVLALFFTVVFYLSNEDIEKTKGLSDQISSSINNAILIEKLDSFAVANDLDYQVSHDLRCDIIQKAVSNTDTIYIDDGLIQLSDANSGFNTVEFFTLSDEEIFEQYDINSKLSKIAISQIRRMALSPSESIRYIIGNSTWVIIVTILLLSILYLILYRNYLYAEHVIFHMIGHTRILLLASAILFINSFTLMLSFAVTFPVLLILGGIYLYLEMKSMYRQSRSLTLFKFLLTLMIYLLTILIVFFIASTISFFIF